MLNNITITDITKTKKKYNALFSGDEFLFSVDDMVLTANHIKIGSVFSSAQLENISKQSDTAKAVEKCYSFLSIRMHSKKELYDKLCRKFDGYASACAVEKMEELGLVDDEKFARLKADYLLNVKNSSVMDTRHKLQALGIDRDIIDIVMADFDIDNQVDSIITLINGKYRYKLDCPQKVVASLMRKGFKFSEIKKAMDILEIDLQEY